MEVGGRARPTQDELLRRGQHVQRECDLILIAFPLQPAQEGRRDGGVLGGIEDGEDEEEEWEGEDEGEDGCCVHGWCAVEAEREAGVVVMLELGDEMRW